MFVRSLLSVALAGGFVLTPAEPGSAPSVTTLKYKIGIAAQSTVDLSVVGAGEQKNSGAFTGFLTITLTDTTGGQALVAVLDSMTVDSASSPQARAQLEGNAGSAKGATWTGLLRKDGKIENLTVTSGGTGAQQFESVLVGFFPRGSAHTRKSGDTWADTLTYTSSSETGTSSLTLVTTFTAAGDATYNGAKALAINTGTVTTSAFNEETPAGDTQFEGTGKGVGRYYVTKDGQYLGGTNTIDSDILVTTAQVPMPIPVTAHTVITVSAIK